MSKHPTEARRDVTDKDLELVDKAIADHEPFLKDLYVLRRVLTEVGRLEQAYRNTKSGIEHLQTEFAEVSRAWEHAKAQLAEVQQQEVKTRQRVAELTAEAAKKEQELRAYSQAIDRITGQAA
jgi:chromosome segregation ATPase